MRNLRFITFASQLMIEQAVVVQKDNTIYQYKIYFAMAVSLCLAYFLAMQQITADECISTHQPLSVARTAQPKLDAPIA